MIRIMKCPTCKEPNLVISERKGIEIDYCPECRGIWLDRGELDKMLEKSREDEQSARPAIEPRREAQHYDKDYKYGHKPYKRKKSFFEEIFD